MHGLGAGTDECETGGGVALLGRGTEKGKEGEGDEEVGVTVCCFQSCQLRDREGRSSWL